MQNKHEKKNHSKLVLSNRKDSEYAFQKNEEQLHREKVLLGYDYIRSTVTRSI